MKAVSELVCCRGLPLPRPVAGSKADRDIEIVIAPVPAGSNDGSPAGTAIENPSRGEAVSVRPRS